MNDLSLNDDHNVKRGNSSKLPLSPQQLALLPSMEEETKRWIAQGFTRDQAERAAKKVIDDKKRALMMEGNTHNSMVRYHQSQFSSVPLFVLNIV